MNNRNLYAIGVFALAATFTGCASQRTVQTGGTSPTPAVSERTEVAERLDTATTVFQQLMAVEEKGIPRELLENANCIAVIPGVKAGAIGVGAKYGKGFVTCRQADGTGWTGPAAVTVAGGTFGLQLGGSETDYVMLVMNERGQERLLSSQFTLGGEASVAAGPVGRTTSAQTDGYMTAEILSWSRARGAFAGVALTGATLKEDIEGNRALYGKPLTNRDIIEGGVGTPAEAKEFISTLSQYSRREGQVKGEQPATPQQQQRQQQQRDQQQ